MRLVDKPQTRKSKRHSNEVRFKAMKKYLIILMIMSLYPSFVFANTYEVETTGEYVMGDRDTKADARRIALEHAKLLAVEQIGTYLESETVVQKSQVTKDEIRTYASAIVKTNVLSENISLLENKTTIFRINIKANVDISVLEKKIDEIKSDTKRRNQIASLQLENIRLLKELENLSTKLKNEKAGQYKKLINERENVLEKIEKNQNSISIAFEKGALLNLAIKDKNELEEYKKNIDDAMQYIADNTKFTVGRPQVRNTGAEADLYINVTWRVENIGEVLSKISKFYKKPTVNASGFIYMHYMFGFKGLHDDELHRYLKQKHIRLYINSGNGSDFANIKDDVINVIFTRGKKELRISDIPIDKLINITDIEAKVIVE
ncbi:MAG: hypothetical protein WC437_05790 [Patescibacteria group bacterium]